VAKSSGTQLGGYRSRFLVTVVICVIMIVITSCRKRQQAVAPPPQPVPPIIVRVETPTPVYSPVPASLPPYVAPPVPGTVEREQADKAYTAGRYDEAIQAYENFLLLSAGGDRRDEALFRLGLSYALRSNGEGDWQHARNSLKQLVNDYPGSPLKPPAAVILTLRAQADGLAGDIKTREQAMRQLSVELERLKQIDAERGRPR
jgi:tetratricopeptide (TPR) repeat protein